MTFHNEGRHAQEGDAVTRTFASIIFAMTMASGAAAEPYGNLSSGAKPCGDFVATSSQGQQIYESWAIGFLTGQNSMDIGSMRGVGSGWSQESVMVWLQNYCTQHPLEHFVTAAEKLRQELAAQEGRLPKGPE